jgi:SAM-dependent methyltransferase
VFHDLVAINARPAVFARTSTVELWTDPHISAQMLTYHLDGTQDVSSYRTEFIDRSVAWLTERFGLGTGRRVADLGCGPGLYTSRLARTGAAVTGVDVSAHSIGYAERTARDEGLAVSYLNRNYLALDLPERFDLIIMIMRDYSALLPEARAALLSVVRRHLAPGGAFVFDVDSLAAFAQRRERAEYAPSLMDGFWSDRPYFGFVNGYRYEAERVFLEKFEIIEADRTRTFLNWVQHYDAESLTAELAGGGLAVESLHADVAGTPYRDGDPWITAVARAVS